MADKNKCPLQFDCYGQNTMQYEFHLLMGILNFTMTNLLSVEGSPIKIYKHCQKAFISQNKRAEFCSERYRNKFNVYKSRAKAKLSNKRKFKKRNLPHKIIFSGRPLLIDFAKSAHNELIKY